MKSSCWQSPPAKMLAPKSSRRRRPYSRSRIPPADGASSIIDRLILPFCLAECTLAASALTSRTFRLLTSLDEYAELDVPA